MAEFLHGLEAEMETPTLYGVFHIAAFLIIIAASVLLSVLGKDSKDKTFRRICLVFWIMYFLFEAYKQTIYSFNYNDGRPYWDYQWYAFPFQLCSSPLYVLPFVFLSKEGSNVRRAAVGYMATYVFFAGAAVMAYPGDVFVRTIGINIQTMFWHGSQVILGSFFLTRHRRELNRRFFVSAVVGFLIMVGVAMALNMTIPNFTDETFNMFFISPKFPSTLPILSAIWPVVPWPVFFLIYLVGYTLAALIVFFAAKGIIKISDKKKKMGT